MSLIEALYLFSSLFVFFGGIYAIRQCCVAIKEMNTFWLTSSETSKITWSKFYLSLFISDVYSSEVALSQSKTKLLKSLWFFLGIVVFVLAVRNGFLYFVVSPTGL